MRGINNQAELSTGGCDPSVRPIYPSLGRVTVSLEDDRESGGGKDDVIAKEFLAVLHLLSASSLNTKLLFAHTIIPDVFGQGLSLV